MYLLDRVRSWLIGLVCLAFGLLSLAAAPRPHVVLVMMDDLGYGDLGCHGSPFIKTPHLDALHATGVRLTDFHAAPMCSPTRGQLLTGRDALRNGASIIASSRMMVREDLPMMPAMFASAGYATALFGKWHLGENHPHRPQDRGFQETLWFPMQEISSLPDHWGNDYFDPVLRRRDGRTEKLTGYCTDIFFREALTWMRRQHEAGKPFLCYLPLNVVHGPQWAPRELRESIARQFPKLSPGQAGYLAMLANADQNFGRLETFLTDTGLRENTVVIFLSGNGGYALIGHYNAGMRDGTYEFAPRRWPEESGLALRAAAPAWTPRDTTTPDHAGFPAGVALPIAGAELRIGEQRVSASIAAADHAAVFRLPLKAGRTEVEATFQDADGRHLCSAFFVTGRRVD